MKRAFSRVCKFFEVFCLIYLLGVGEVLANIGELENLISYQKMLTYGAGAKELNTKFSKELVRKTHDFIKNPGNKVHLKSPLGTKLLENHSKILNFNALKESLEDCVGENDDDRHLKERIIDAAGSSFHLSVPCSKSITKISDIEDYVQLVTAPTNRILSESFEDQLSKQGIETTLKTSLKVKYKYDPNFMKNESISEEELDDLILKICEEGKSCYKNQKSFKANLRETLKDYSKEISQSEERIKPYTAVRQLNKKIKTINSKLKDLKIRAEDRWYWWDKAVMDDAEEKKKFDTYLQTYLQESSTGAGSLLLTDSMRDATGRLRTFNDDSDNIEQKGEKFIFKKHKKIKLKDFNDSIIEVNTKIQEQLDDYKSSSMKSIQDKKLVEATSKGRMGNAYKRMSKRNREDSIKDLIRHNPISAGQALLQNPEYSLLACKAIKDITRDDRDEKVFNERAILIGAIGGGLLMATGVGAIAGGWLLTGSLTAGVAAGTVGGTILAATTTSALVLGGAESAYFSSKAWDDYNEVQSLDRSIIAESADRDSIVERRDELTEFKEARFDAALALGFTALDLGAMKGLKYMARGGKSAISKFTPKQRSSLKSIYSEINNPKSLDILKDTISRLGIDGNKKLDQFLGVLANAEDELRVDFLKKLNNGNLNAKKVKALTEKILEASNKCSK